MVSYGNTFKNGDDWGMVDCFAHSICIGLECKRCIMDLATQLIRTLFVYPVIAFKLCFKHESGSKFCTPHKMLCKAIVNQLNIINICQIISIYKVIKMYILYMNNRNVLNC